MHNNPTADMHNIMQVDSMYGSDTFDRHGQLLSKPGQPELSLSNCKSVHKKPSNTACVLSKIRNMCKSSTGYHLNCVSSSISRSLSTHELETISPATQDSSQQCNPATIPVLQVGTDAGFGHPKSWLVQEADVDENSASEEGQGEVEECRVDD